MRKIVYIFIFTLTLFSCGNKEEETPSGILSEEKMVVVLIDMYTLEGKVIHGQLIVGESYQQGINAYLELFKKHGTDKNQVEKSIDYYVHRPEIMRKIQVQVLDSLNVKSR